MTSSFLLPTYLTLISAFYVNTDGFQYHSTLYYATLKTIPIWTLAALVFQGHGHLKGDDKLFQALGLVFGGIGDFLLGLYDEGLIPGAMAFAIGHLLYMARFGLKIRSVSYELAFLVLVYGFCMNHFFLIPQFFSNPIPTLILMVYAFILCTALVLSGSLYFNGSKTQPPRQKNNLIRFLGYGLFFFSDSLLLLCHAGFVFSHINVLVLSTYYASQYMILLGQISQFI